VSGSTGPPGETDYVFMLQAKGGLELELAKKKNARRTNADIAKVRTATHNPNIPTVSSALASNAESEVMTTARSDDGSLQPYLRLSLASVEMWRTKAVRLWRSEVMAQSSSFSVPLMLILLLVGCSGTACCLFAFIRWKGPVHETSYEMVAETRDDSLSASDMRSPLSSPAFSERTSTTILQRASPSKESRFSLPMPPFREAIAKGKSQTKIVILDKVGDACLNILIGAIIEVSAMQDDSGRRAVVGPQPNISKVNPRSFRIDAQNVILRGKNLRLREMSATFNATLEEQGDGSYTVLQDKEPVMYLRAGPDVHQLMVTTDHWELASVRQTSGDHLDIRVKPDADAILVLACALAVVSRVFV